MKRKTVSLDQLAKELGAYTEESLKELRQATLLGVAKSLPMLVEKSPVDTGLYAQSWDFNETEKSIFLGNYAPYAPIIEYGTREPFTPPIGPLLGWAKRVLKDPSQPPNYSSRVWALAKHTQALIAKRGMLPRHIMENAIPEIIENIKREYQALNG